MTDMIVYTVVTEPGGVDGKDPTDKGGVMVRATFDKEQAQQHVGNDSRMKVMPIVIDTEVVLTDMLSKLNMVERLFFKFEAQLPPVKRAPHDGRGPG